jgi:hypothetical protein
VFVVLSLVYWIRGGQRLSIAQLNSVGQHGRALLEYKLRRVQLLLRRLSLLLGTDEIFLVHVQRT